MKRHLKTILGFVILIATLAVFAHYLQGHPEIIRQLKSTEPRLLAVLLVAYAVWWGALAWVLQINLRMFRKKMPAQENILLSAYSSLLNFFGPGQSGPGLRAIYLKKRHNMRVKDYIFATLLYYACYAVISATFLFIGTRPWWQTAGLIVAAGAASTIVLRWYMKRSNIGGGEGLNVVTMGWLFVATTVQLLAQFVIYFIEISSINTHVGVGQALAYTGAANFSLFVALTPGAIGIRESFLLFSQGLHHIGSSTIVAANVIDRAIYLVFLGLLFVLVLSMHAGKKLKWRQTVQDAEKE